MPTGPKARDAAGAALLDRLRADPGRAALLTDIDGTLAPIAERPGEAVVPRRASELLRALGEAFGIVGCVSGRQAIEARRLVGVEEIAYAGNHGLELLLPGEITARLDPALGEAAEAAAGFVARLDQARISAIGLRLEDKGPIQALHWRGAPSEESAERLAHEIAAQAAADGLSPHWGRKVLELRPRGGAGKDAAVTALLSGGEATAAVYAGDDRTDLDAFRRLREMREEGELETAICVGIASPEGPPELAADSDVIVDGPEGWLAMLETLAG